MSIIKKKLFLIVILSAAVFLSGCDFFPSEKKTEIKFKESLPENSGEEKLVTEEKNSEENIVPEDIQESAKSKDAVQNPKPETVIPTPSEPEKKADESAPSFKIIDRPANWGYAKSSGRKIDAVIIHSSYNSLGGDVHSLDKVLDIYKSYGVSPHYIISREGKVYRLVEDKNVAYHAGVSEVPDGRENVNDFSIGVEIINTKSESPSGAQYVSLKNLISYLKEKYDIKYVLGHSDIASGRKDDPWNFDWKKIK